jgi:hypothetical protein
MSCANWIGAAVEERVDPRSANAPIDSEQIRFVLRRAHADLERRQLCIRRVEEDEPDAKDPAEGVEASEHGTGGTDRRQDRCSAIIGFGLSIEISNKLRWIQSDGVCEIEEFDHIDPSLAALDTRDVGLPAIQTLGKRGLGQLRVFPRLRQQLS